MLHIITGNRGIGKTTALLAYRDKLTDEGKRISGILTPPLFDQDGNKAGFAALNVESGETWDLGRSDKKLDGPEYGPFSFSSRGFERALEVLREGLKSPRDVLFLDEIGPLELHRKKGFYPFLPEIDKAALNHEFLLVIRPELIEEFLERYRNKAEWRVTEINKVNRGANPLID